MKTNNLGKPLSREEQKNIKGGIVHCSSEHDGPDYQYVICSCDETCVVAPWLGEPGISGFTPDEICSDYCGGTGVMACYSDSACTMEIV